MNPTDDQINRLFRAASQVRPEPMPGPAYGLEARAMASWRAAQFGEHGFRDMAFLTRGLLLAVVIMAISFWPALNATSNPFADFIQLTDSTMLTAATP